jgi:anthranilate phosphoribosyltransferase
LAEPTFSDLLRTVLAGRSLDRERTRWAFGQIMDGAWPESQIAGLLVALAGKGASQEELTGAAEAMRQRSTRIETGGAEALDTCGTGGSGISTFNISTAAALVAAGAGVKVAKHGNRTNARASGSADVLAALGVNVDAPPAAVARCLREAGVCFCFAVRCHPAMKHAAPVRKALGVRTIFNLLGPLTNPAGARRQLMGVFDGAYVEIIARVLGALGSLRAMVVHAEDGLDEISTTAPTMVSEFRDVATTTIRPEDFGIARGGIDDLLVSSAKASAEVVRGVLAGARGPARDIVVLNAAAALAVADRAPTIAAGIAPAAESIDSGAAKAALEKLIRVSNAELPKPAGEAVP